jgi:hypothetical protein
MTDETPKTINITGTNNRYHMKKLIHKEVNKEPKKRVVSEKWSFPEEYFEYSNQLKVVSTILNDIKNGKNIPDEKYVEGEKEGDVIKIVIQQINKKISGYKQQDIIKKKLNNDKFIALEEIIRKMVECELKCRYCKEPMNVLYDISREMKQWSVDRVDNDFGHNIDNFHLACLDCNLKRRRRTDEKFLFTKQLNIVKQDS